MPLLFNYLDSIDVFLQFDFNVLCIQILTYYLIGCDSKDCNTCTCEQYCCCTNNEHSSVCDDLTNKDYKNSKKTSKMDQTKSESINDGNSNSDLNESNANGKDCDTNSEHSSMMNGSIHSSYNNRYKHIKALKL